MIRKLPCLQRRGEKSHETDTTNNILQGNLKKSRISNDLLETPIYWEQPPSRFVIQQRRKTKLTDEEQVSFGSRVEA